MNAYACIALLAVAGLGLPGAAALAQQKLYRWVDDQGVVHYGDHIPPEYADRDRAILNEQAVTVGFEQRQISDSERAALEQKKAAQAAAEQARAETARRDRMLLDTYLTVEDIEDLRDRRLELLASQITVTELYLADLRKRLSTLQAEADALSKREGSPPVPEPLTRDIARTTASITRYEETLTRTRAEKTKLKEAFDSDIARFKELKGG